MTNFKELNFLVDELRKLDTGDNHILITGDIKVGKTTLLKAFIEKYYSKSKIDGVMTELVITDKFRIVLYRYGHNEINIIGERDLFGMKFYSEKFESLSLEIFNSLDSNLDILVLDELGNKEINLKNYEEKLISKFKEFRIFGVLKKSGNLIFKNIDKLDNYVIFDLDKYYE